MSSWGDERKTQSTSATSGGATAGAVLSFISNKDGWVLDPPRQDFGILLRSSLTDPPWEMEGAELLWLPPPRVSPGSGEEGGTEGAKKLAISGSFGRAVLERPEVGRW